MTFAVKLPAYVHAAVHNILHQATLSSAGTLRVQACCSAQAGLLGKPTMHGEMSGRAGAALGVGGLAVAVGEAEQGDDDSASSMGASGFEQGLAYEHAPPAPGLLHDGGFVRSGGDAVGVGMAASGRTASQVGMSMKTASANMSDEDDDSDQLTDVEMPERVGAYGEAGASGDDSADSDLLGCGTDGVARSMGALGFMAAGIANVSPTPAADVAEGSAPPADQTAVQLQLTVLIHDQEVRLGSLVQDPAAAEGALHIPPEMLEEDLNKRKLQLVSLLRLQQPDKDPNQNRYAMSQVFAVAGHLPACMDTCLYQPPFLISHQWSHHGARPCANALAPVAQNLEPCLTTIVEGSEHVPGCHMP